MKKVLKQWASLLLLTVMVVANVLATGRIEKIQAATSVSGVSKVSNMSSDFMRGVDVSAVAALEKSGVSYKYLDGTSGDVFDIFAGAGVNYVRIRIWNNPYDSSSPYKGYGGGNCDLYNAKILGKRATDAGMKVFIDFHYSDFWADPAKQFAPKAWKNYSLSYKKDAVYNFTYQSIKELLDYGVDIGMVQIGNETNSTMCGVGGLYDGVWNFSSGVATLMQQGCYAVDDINSLYGKSILKVLHFTDLLANGKWYAQCMAEQGVDYDVFATSYYPMWHGSASDLQDTLTYIAKTYNKKVLVAETAYPYTYDNFDSQGNNIGDSSAMNFKDYNVSVSGQAQALRDVFSAVAQVNKTKSGYGFGAFYWEPEWIATNSSTWGSCGSGWASSTSGNYEYSNSGLNSLYSSSDGGSTWDNMTLFDKNGQAMKSLYVFNDICGKESTTSSGISAADNLDGTYYIRSCFSSKYLEIANGSSSNGAVLQQNTYTGKTQQKFKLVKGENGYYSIYTGSSDYTKVLDVKGKSTADGTTILQYSDSQKTNQKFELVEISSGVYAIKTCVTSGTSGLDVYGWNTADLAPVKQWNYWGGACQLWYLEKAQ